ncbi:SMC-Scp complex subunit ScpB [Roseococcus sp. SDR]|uniref:SMC-Scp complex subunit ScpB n=1 Tax=Roseococcus sp. SDR TaxID=2835532 RepID=UPI001BD0D764|nr:SMC-Scp complex subunit ScpB [Roseococcus sp. SDR]MBS7792498.1 SMC-Scp complex subunit ScpB [Roseococcus sp. SDR]MBV1847812.1 SMC-Scp complex subunit ScpB [Roseococcus sp. SDR]
MPADTDIEAPAETPAVNPADFEHGLRVAEALIFASERPVPAARVQLALPPGIDAQSVLTALLARTAGRPVELVEVGGGYAFRTAQDLAPAITRVVEVPRRLPRVAMEALSIVAYHQPVTRAEIEEIRGAALAQASLDALLDAGLIAPRGRKEAPGRPTLWATTARFLDQFGLKSLNELPRKEELVSSDIAAMELAPPPTGAPPLIAEGQHAA